MPFLLQRSYLKWRGSAQKGMRPIDHFTPAMGSLLHATPEVIDCLLRPLDVSCRFRGAGPKSRPASGDPRQATGGGQGGRRSAVRTLKEKFSSITLPSGRLRYCLRVLRLPSWGHDADVFSSAGRDRSGRKPLYPHPALPRIRRPAFPQQKAHEAPCTTRSWYVIRGS